MQTDTKQPSQDEIDKNDKKQFGIALDQIISNSALSRKEHLLILEGMLKYFPESYDQQATPIVEK
jgi:hypothetical protein